MASGRVTRPCASCGLVHTEVVDFEARHADVLEDVIRHFMKGAAVCTTDLPRIADSLGKPCRVGQQGYVSHRRQKG